MKIEGIKEQCREAIRLGEAATSGPWNQAATFYLVGNDRKEIADFCDGPQPALERCANLKFIAHSRTFSPNAARALLLCIAEFENEIATEQAGCIRYCRAQKKLNEICKNWTP